MNRNMMMIFQVKFDKFMHINFMDMKIMFYQKRRTECANAFKLFNIRCFEYIITLGTNAQFFHTH